MSSSSLLLFSLCVFSALVALALIIFLWRRRHSEGASFLILFESFALVWVLGDMLEGIAVSLEQKIGWSQIAYIGNIYPAAYLRHCLFCWSLSYPEPCVTRIVPPILIGERSY